MTNSHRICRSIRPTLSGLVTVCGLMALLAVPALAGAETLDVGPGRTYEELDEVPWESLEPGDRVVIGPRDEPYKSKFVIAAQGTASNPIIVAGRSGADGQRPVIEGRDATTRDALNYWSEERGVIKIGGANQPDVDRPSHIIVEGLEIANARSPYEFDGRNGTTAYNSNAAAIYVESGDHITVRDCVLRDSGNGLFVAKGTTNMVVQRNHFYGNGVEGSYLEHNSYTEADGILFEFNHYGPLCDGCGGNNLKDRSTGTVVRYNWIEGGNRQLDLVDSAEFASYPGYDETHVYGNLLIEHDGEGNRQILHYGGDGSDESVYRKGTLYFYHNTVVSTRQGRTTLARLSTNDEQALAYNNIVYASAGGDEISYLDDTGRLELRHNWFSDTPVEAFGSFSGQVDADGSNLFGEEPGFVDVDRQDYSLRDDAEVRDQAGPLPPGAGWEHEPTSQYVPHTRSEARGDRHSRDMGAIGVDDELPDVGGSVDVGGGDAGAGSPDTGPQPDAGTGSDTSGSEDNDAGASAGNTSSGGASSCAVAAPAGGPAPVAWVLAAGLLVFVWRRRHTSLGRKRPQTIAMVAVVALAITACESSPSSSSDSSPRESAVAQPSTESADSAESSERTQGAASAAESYSYTHAQPGGPEVPVELMVEVATQRSLVDKLGESVWQVSFWIGSAEGEAEFFPEQEGEGRASIAWWAHEGRKPPVGQFDMVVRKQDGVWYVGELDELSAPDRARFGAPAADEPAAGSIDEFLAHPGMQRLKEQAEQYPVSPDSTALTQHDGLADQWPVDKEDTLSPGRALVSLIGELELGRQSHETTLRLMLDGDEKAVGVIMEWGMMDDSVAGRDYKVDLRRVENRWTVEHVEQRQHCRRGISDEGLCL